MTGKVLVIAATPPPGAPPAVIDAWLIRQRANLTGRCECGATITLPNRAARRAAEARGEPVRATMLHEADCPASDEALAALYRAALS